MAGRFSFQILRLSEAALTQTTSGQVVNLLSNDVSRFDDLCYFFHFIWISPIAVTSPTILRVINQLLSQRFPFELHDPAPSFSKVSPRIVAPSTLHKAESVSTIYHLDHFEFTIPFSKIFDHVPQVLIVGVIIWQKVGFSTVVGIGTLILMTLPVYTIFVNMSRHLREAIAGLTDKRVQMMNELIAGIQVGSAYSILDTRGHGSHLFQ